MDEDCIGDIKLLWAILYRAMLDAMGGYKTCRDSSIEDQEDAREWLGLFKLNLPNHTPEPWSAEWICSILDIEIEQIRDQVEHAILTGYRPRSMATEHIAHLVLEKALHRF